MACAKASPGVCNGNGHGKGGPANLPVQEPWEKVIVRLILGVKLQFVCKKYFVRLKTADHSHSLFKVLHRGGEGHVPITDHSLIDDLNINYIYATVYFCASS